MDDALLPLVFKEAYGHWWIGKYGHWSIVKNTELQ